MKQKIYFALILTVLFGCRESSTSPEQNNSNEWFSSLSNVSVVVPQTPIQSQLSFYFTELIETDKRTVKLTFQTNQIYSSGGYSIVSNMVRTGTNIDVQLESIKTPEGGTGIFAPAISSFNLGELSNDLYALKITMNGKTLQGLMMLTDTSYLIKIQPNNMLIPSRPRLLRVPKNIIWGQAESISPIEYKLFMDSLKFIGAKTELLTIGDYYHFKMISKDSFSINSVLGFRYGQFFLLKYDGDILDTKNLVQRFAKRYHDSIYIQLTGGRGEMYYSTILGL